MVSGGLVLYLIVYQLFVVVNNSIVYNHKQPQLFTTTIIELGTFRPASDTTLPAIFWQLPRSDSEPPAMSFWQPSRARRSCGGP